MPLKRLITLTGEEIELTKIDIIKDCDKFGVSPATLQMLLEHQTSREDVASDEVTASQIDKGTRQAYLEDITDFAMTPHKLISGTMGTMKHSIVNIGSDQIISEVRFKSKNGHLSAKHDNAVVVHRGNKTLDLYDLKAIGWFKVKMILELGIWQEGYSYAMQLNLQAALIEVNTDYRIDRLFLEFMPRDIDARKRIEAEKLGISDPSVILYEVPRLASESVIASYEMVYEERKKAHREGYAPICNEKIRWLNKKTGVSTRCQSYCPVLAECQAMCAKHNEVHPLEETNTKVAEKALSKVQYDPKQFEQSVALLT